MTLTADAADGDAVGQEVFNLVEIGLGVVAALDEYAVIVDAEEGVGVAGFCHPGHFADDAVAEASAEELAVNHFVVEVEFGYATLEMFRYADCAARDSGAELVVIEFFEPGHNEFIFFPEDAVAAHRDIVIAADLPDFVCDVVIDDAGLFFAVIPFEGVFVDGVVEIFAEDFDEHFSVFGGHRGCIFGGEVIGNGRAEEKFVANLLDIYISAGLGFDRENAHTDFSDLGVDNGKGRLIRNIALSQTNGGDKRNCRQK